MNLLKNNGWKCLWRGHPAQPTDQLKPLSVSPCVSLVSLFQTPFALSLSLSLSLSQSAYCWGRPAMSCPSFPVPDGQRTSLTPLLHSTHTPTDHIQALEPARRHMPVAPTRAWASALALMCLLVIAWGHSEAHRPSILSAVGGSLRAAARREAIVHRLRTRVGARTRPDGAGPTRPLNPMVTSRARGGVDGLGVGHGADGGTAPVPRSPWLAVPTAALTAATLVIVVFLLRRGRSPVVDCTAPLKAGPATSPVPRQGPTALGAAVSARDTDPAIVAALGAPPDWTRTGDHPANWCLQGLYAPVVGDARVVDLPVEGCLPADLDGVWLRNGPNPAVPPYRAALHHWFDGDGMVHHVRLRGAAGAAAYGRAHVRTRALARDAAAGRATYGGMRAMFPTGDLFPGCLAAKLRQWRRPDAPFWIVQTKNSANNGVLWHGGRLLATYEAGAPYAMDLAAGPALTTLGVEDFAGAWGTAELWRHNFSAHAKRCAATGQLVSISYNLGVGSLEPIVRFTVFGADATGGAPIHSVEVWGAPPPAVQSGRSGGGRGRVEGGNDGAGPGPCGRVRFFVFLLAAGIVDSAGNRRGNR